MAYYGRRVIRRYRKSGGGGLVKRARGNLKASKSGTDSCTQTITFTHPIALTGDILSGTNEGEYFYPGVMALNIWDLLSRAENFKAFRRMYEQCKIDYVYVKLNVTNSQISTADSQKMYDIYVAWDRTGISHDDILPYSVNDVYKGFRYVIGPRISEISNSKTQLNAFQRWSKNMYIAPRSLQEKSQYVSTSEVFEWRKAYDYSHQVYPFLNDVANEKDFEILLNMNNPGILTENGKYPFKPTLLIGAFGSGMKAGTGGQTDVVQMNLPLDSSTKIIMTCEFKVVLTFRGAKGGQTVA